MNALVVLSTLLVASQAQYLAAPYAAGFGYPYGNLYNGLAAPLAYNAPLAAAPLAAPIAAAPAPIAPITAPSSQFQAQDEFGNVNYGYSNINSAKQEAGNAYGGVTGSYSYVDANGIPQRVDYIADGAGFRVKATNLPVAPVHALESPVYTGIAPAPVVDTPEVAAAKAEFQAAYDEAVARAKRSADGEPILPYAALPYAGYPYAYGAYPYNTYGAYNLGLGYAGLPYAAAYNYGYAAPAPIAAAPAAVTYAAPAAVAAPAAAITAAPAAREAILTKIQLNPGHAVAYRVD